MYSLESEQSVLVEIMFNNSLFDSCKLTEDHFYSPENKCLFNAISKLIGSGENADSITVGWSIENDSIIGVEYVNDICEISRGSEENFFSYVRILDKKLKERLTISAVEELQNNSNKEEARENLLSRLEEINQRFEMEETTISTTNDLMRRLVDKLDERSQKGYQLSGVDSGFDELNDMTHGLQSSDLIILGARPSMGKTAFSMSLAESALRTQSKQVLVYSIEMPADGITERLASQIGKISSNRMKDGQLSTEEWARFAAFGKFMDGKKLIIDDHSTVSPAYLRSTTRQIAKNGDIGLIVVDYLQLMTIPGFKGGRVQEISEISRSLKALAKEHKCPVVALSQLSRDCEKRPDKRPMNSDLRDSGAIEQDADVILFLYRDEVYNENSEDKGTGEVIIGKNRNGEVGKFRAGFEGRFTRWHKLEESQI